MKFGTRILFGVYSIWICCTAVMGARILISAPYGTKSHQNMYKPLVKALVSRGHHITIITNYATAEHQQMENVREIVLDKLVIDMSMFPNYFDYLLHPYKNLYKYLQVMYKGLFVTPLEVVETTYGDPRIKQLIANDRFDLLLISQACTLSSYPLAWHFQAPFVVLSPNVLFPKLATVLGDDEHYSYVPFLMTSFTDQMSFYERTVNLIVSQLFSYVFNDLHRPAVQSIVQRSGLTSCPSIDEIEKNVSLVLTNSHPSFSYPRTLPPQVIEVGGVHCRPAKPLPADLESFVSSSKDGFILFAVGSTLSMDEMPAIMLEAFIKAFARLPQRVIWQWKGTPRADLPENVMSMAWLPQQDLLGHKGCRAFLTHGGLNSLQEAIYHGVPVIGLPFGSDQALNLARAVRDGYALKVDWKDVTEETLTSALQQVLLNQTYSDTVADLSLLFRDQVQPPLDRSIFWIEFVLRHKGTEHLRLGSRDLNSLQRNLVDVYLVFIVAVLLPILFTYLCVRTCCCRTKKPKTTPLDAKKKN